MNNTLKYEAGVYYSLEKIALTGTPGITGFNGAAPRTWEVGMNTELGINEDGQALKIVDENGQPDANQKIASIILTSIGSDLNEPNYLHVTRRDVITFSYTLSHTCFLGTFTDGNLQYIVGSN